MKHNAHRFLTPSSLRQTPIDVGIDDWVRVFLAILRRRSRRIVLSSLNFRARSFPISSCSVSLIIYSERTGELSLDVSSISSRIGIARWKPWSKLEVDELRNLSNEFCCRTRRITFSGSEIATVSKWGQFKFPTNTVKSNLFRSCPQIKIIGWISLHLAVVIIHKKQES